MPRIPKRLIALGGLAVAGAAVLRRRRAALPPAPVPPPTPTPTPPAATTPPPTPPVAATPPVETPGPSVTPPGTGSETERAERAEATVPDSEVLQGRSRSTSDALVDAETEAAAAEARAIGGPGVDDAHGNPAMEAVYEAGGGESEGFEAAEYLLVENASHGEGHAEPMSDAFTPEVESDEATAVDGEADHERVSEVDEDADNR
jgi:hypothetical protein